MKIKKGDTVQVITGKDKGKQGEVVRVLPTADKLIVSGVNTASKHAKARRANEQAGIVDRDMPIHVSNVMLVHKGKPVRVGFELGNDGKKVRVAKVGGGKTEAIK